MNSIFWLSLFYCILETLVWKYVGEKGEEITGRNSHSLHIITVPSTSSSVVVNYLVLYGGASPEHGPSNEVFYSILPSNIDDIGNYRSGYLYYLFFLSIYCLIQIIFILHDIFSFKNYYVM